MNRPHKGFASLVLIIALVIIIGGGAAWWAMNKPSTSPTAATTTKSTQQSTTSQTYTNASAGFETTIPNSWTAVAGANNSVSFKSPDYALKSSAEANDHYGESMNWVKQGVIISVFYPKNKVDPSIQSPAAYVQFKLAIKSSNPVMLKEISLGGQPAILSQTRRDDGSLSTYVGTIRNGREFQITLGFADEASMDWTIWDRFLSNFKFL